MELNKLMNEKERLVLELDECQAKYKKSQKELREQTDEVKALREEINRLTLLNDELQEKNGYYMRKYNTAKLEQQNAAKPIDNSNTQRLNDIEKILSNLQSEVTVKKKYEEIYEWDRQEEHTRIRKQDDNPNELENCKKNLKKFTSLIKKLIFGLKRNYLKNPQVREIFKLEDVNSGNEHAAYKNLLKLLAA